jgi:hypothetical protein
MKVTLVACEKIGKAGARTNKTASPILKHLDGIDRGKLWNSGKPISMSSG